jgi:hypothetical protein
LLRRHARLQRLAAGITLITEEMLASLLGSLLVDSPSDRDDLIHKAASEVVQRGMDPGLAVHRLQDLRALLEKLL